MTHATDYAAFAAFQNKSATRASDVHHRATLLFESYDSYGKRRWRLTLECGHVTTACNRLKQVPCGECRALTE